jgi:hypothetical protein
MPSPPVEIALDRLDELLRRLVAAEPRADDGG